MLRSDLKILDSVSESKIIKNESIKHERLMTMSKIFFDDEIEMVLPNGDIHLKMNVHRKAYSFKDIDLSKDDSYIIGNGVFGNINYHALEADSHRERVRASMDADGLDDDVINKWERE